MMGRQTAKLRRISALAIPASMPGLTVLGTLVLWGMLAPEPALIAGGAILLLTSLVIGRFAISIATVRETVEDIAAEDLPEAAPLRPLTPVPSQAADDMRLTILRLTRIWRERVRAAEGQLAAAEAVIAAVPDPLILLDERRQIVRANAQARALVGAVSGPRDLAAVVRNPAVLEAADAVLRGEPARVVDFTIAVPVERQLRARFARIDRPSLEGAVAVLTLHDITQLKRAEQMRADFIANASHELRTPLTTLIGFIETLRGPAREDAQARDRFLAIMHQQSSRMTRLVEDLLSLSRIELNEHVMPKDRVALRPLLHQVAEALELRAGERGMRILLAVAPDLPAVLGDRDELAQIFQNLIDNAIKYGRTGTEITISAQTVLRSSREGDAGSIPFVSIAVRDHGEGIAHEHLPRLTERFYRVDTARSREMGGTGLGLAIVKHILNHHRGFLEIESTPGVGSMFTVFLRPRPQPAEPPEPCSAVS